MILSPLKFRNNSLLIVFLIVFSVGCNKTKEVSEKTMQLKNGMKINQVEETLNVQLDKAVSSNRNDSTFYMTYTVDKVFSYDFVAIFSKKDSTLLHYYIED